MNAYKDIKDDITKFISSSLNLKLTQNAQVGGGFYQPTAITSKYSIFADEEYYRNNYSKNYEEGKYFIALMDGSYFQINYEFSVRSKYKSEVSKMNLCFLPNVKEDKLVKEYIRIDYDQESFSFFHSMAHMHVGFKNDVRIPLDDIMLFSKFFQLILYLYYKDDFIIWNDSLEKPLIIGHTKKLSDNDKLTKYDPLAEEISKFLFFKHINA